MTCFCDERFYHGVRDMGRRRGSRNKGFYYVKNRGWATEIEGRRVFLLNENGDRMREKNTPTADVKAAYLRAISGQDVEEPEDSVTVLDICQASLAKVEDDGAPSTYEARQRTLFDFCFGLPSRFIPREGNPKKKPKPSDYIHNGYGNGS